MLQSEEEVLCTVAMQTGNAAMTLLANAIRRALAYTSEDAEPHAELESALPRLEAFEQALGQSDLTLAASLLEELCLCREPTYGQLVLRTAETRPATD